MLAVAALGVALGIASNAMRGDVAGEYFGTLPAVVLPTITGRVVRRLHEVISLATVKTHVRHVLQKPRLRDRVQAVVAAYESGLVVRTRG